MNYTKDICIIGGAGHVGLPLGIVFASRGQKVVIYDINQKALDLIQQGQIPFMEKGAEPLLRSVLDNGNFCVSADPNVVSGAKNVIITIGTPVDEFLNPVFKVMRNFLDDFLPYFSEDQLVILRSTVYPGTTEWLDRHIQSQGKRIKLAFCPERVVQGLAIEEITGLPQIVSGTSPEAEQEAAVLFSLIAPEIVPLSPKEAEFAKLFTNSYRYIQFAAANQFYMMTTSAGVDYERVLKGLKKNYPRSRDLPRAGFAAGPCLFKDTMQLAAFSNNQFNLGQAAMLVNEGMVLYVVDQTDQKYHLADKTVGILGMAFKAENDDIRSSLSYKLKKVLLFRAAKVLTHDPYVSMDDDLLPLETVVEQSDLLIIAAPHKAYQDLVAPGKIIVDIWGLLGKGTLI